MDIFASPVITIALNVIAQALVSQGIIDAHNKDTFIQLGQQLIAAIGTLVIAIYSISKVVDLKKHQLTTISQSMMTNQANLAVVPAVESDTFTPAPTKDTTEPVVEQTGLPIAQ